MRVMIIGNGAGGNEAAQTLRQHDSGVAITILGQEETGFYSPCALPDYLAGWIPRQQLFLREPAVYNTEGITLSLGQRVEAIDPDAHEVAVNGQPISFDRLILATGSRPFIPPVDGCALPGNFVIRTVDDIDRILAYKPCRAVVIGSGNIGVEVAEALQIKGCAVSIVEMQQHLMPRLFDPYPAAVIQNMLENHGITVYTGEKAVEVQGTDKVERLITNCRVLDCDSIIWAAGVVQNTELASAAGLEIGPLGGIQVNERMQTSCQDIFACGDCIESPDLLRGKPSLSLLWPSAKAQARIAAMNCLGLDALYPGSFNLIVEELYGTPCAAAGLKEEDLAPAGRVWERKAPGAYYRLLIQDDHLAGIQAVGRLDAVGPLVAMIKNRTSLNSVRRILRTPSLLQKAPWLADVSRLLPDYDELA